MRINGYHPGKLLRETKQIALDALLGKEVNRGTYIDTMVGPASREFLYTAAKNLPLGSIIVEIGCYAGGSTLYLRKGAKKSNSYVYSIDPFDSELERQLAESDGSKHLQRVQQGTQTKPSRKKVDASLEWRGVADFGMLIQGFSADIASRWNYGPIHFLFIDGNHDRALEDYRAWKPHLAKNAIVAFDDANQLYKGARDSTVAAVEMVLREEMSTKGKVELLSPVERIVAFRFS